MTPQITPTKEKSILKAVKKASNPQELISMFSNKQLVEFLKEAGGYTDKDVKKMASSAAMEIWMRFR